jgi:hypothetical protein
MNAKLTNSENPIALINLHQHVAAVRQILESHLAARKSQIAPENFTDTTQLPPHPALTQLGNKFNLSPFDRYILLLCVSVELDPIVGQLCADFHGNPQLRYPTPFLAYNTFSTPTWSAFKATSPLIAWQLIEIKKERVLTHSSIEIHPSILFYLLCNSCEEPQLQDIIIPVNTDYHHQKLPPSHQQIVSQIIEIRSQKTEFFTISSIVQLCGDERRAKIAIAAGAAASYGCALNQISLSWLVALLNSPASSLTLEKFIKLYSRFALLTDSILLIDCEEINSTEPTEIKLLNQLLSKSNNPTIVLSRTRINIADRSIVTIDIPKLTPDEQATIWRIHLGETAAELGEYIDSLTNQFNLPATAIESACLHSFASMQQSIKANTAFDLKTALWDNCRIYARPRLDSLATRIETSRTWDDLILPPRKKQALKKLFGTSNKIHSLWKWGFGKKQEDWELMLIFRHSGTGKTTAAEIIAKELRLDLYRIDLSAVVSKYIGETEKNLAQIFAAAEASSVVLLFDEADSLFGQRSQVKDSRDRYANLEVSYLLQRMEAYQGLSILTTNFKDAIDSAFERRLRFVVDFPFPDIVQRLEMWQRVFPQKTPTDKLDFQKLSNLAVTGANIRNIALNGAFLAAQAGEAVQMKHLLEAALRECKKEGRATIGTSNWVKEDKVRSRQR